MLTHSCYLSAEKNLKALKIILKELPANVRLAFVGDGPERAALQQEYADMPNVKFMVSSQLRSPANGWSCCSDTAHTYVSALPAFEFWST